MKSFSKKTFLSSRFHAFHSAEIFLHLAPVQGMRAIEPLRTDSYRNHNDSLNTGSGRRSPACT
ncbi:MAG: hypothetical protein JJE25_01685 [Bacteroidia bacterium]|nr:hypothetical protein [Bacteroidia bacterium]